MQPLPKYFGCLLLWLPFVEFVSVLCVWCLNHFYVLFSRRQTFVNIFYGELK